PDTMIKEVDTLSKQVDALNDRLDSFKAVAQHPDAEYGKEFNVGKFLVTAYSPYENNNGIQADATPNTTATGTTPKPGTIAVDPTIIPYGSTIIIMYSDGTVERGKAEDTGGAIDGNHIDVFRYKFETASEFGKREAVVIWY